MSIEFTIRKNMSEKKNRSNKVEEFCKSLLNYYIILHYITGVCYGLTYFLLYYVIAPGTLLRSGLSDYWIHIVIYILCLINMIFKDFEVLFFCIARRYFYRKRVILINSKFIRSKFIFL